jgi:Anti-sigma factor NepR
MESQQPERRAGPRSLLPADSGFWDIELRARIGRDLRSIFQGTLDEPLPPHLDQLLAEIERGALPPDPQNGPG